MQNRLPLFFIVTALFWFALYAYVPYVAPYAELLYADMRLIGFIAGSYGFVQMVIRFPLGIFSDRLRKRKIFIMAGLVFAAVSGMVVYVFSTPMALFAARSLAGAAASSWVVFTVLGAAYNKPEDTVKTMGTLNACNSFGRMSALLLGGIVAQWFGFSYAFLLAGVAGLAALILSFGIVEKKPEMAQPPKFSQLLEAVLNRQLLCASFLAIFSQYISFATTFGFMPLVAARLGASNFTLGMLGVASTLPGLVAAPFVVTIMKKTGVRSVLLCGFLISAAACMVMPLCQEIWQLFIIQIINNTSLIAVMTVLMGLCIKNSAHRATAMGFFQAVYGLGMFLGPFIMGWISYGFGLMAAFIFTGGVGVFAGLVSVVFTCKKYLTNT